MKPADIVYLTWQCSYGVGKWESSNYDVPFFFFFPPATALSDSTLHSLKFLPQLYTTTDSSQTGTKSVTDYTWEFLSLSIIFKPCCALINFEHELPAPPLPRSNRAQAKCCWSLAQAALCTHWEPHVPKTSDILNFSEQRKVQWVGSCLLHISLGNV